MKNVVITGGTAGIGLATARHFADRGWRVAVMARDPERLEAARRDIEARGAPALALQGDVADPEAQQRLADAVASEWGAIDVWINNAMTTVYAPVAALTPEELRRVTDVVYHGQAIGTMAALKHMRPRDSGTIVQVGSALAHRAIPLQSAYCAAKFAVRGFTDSLRSELAHEGSRIRLTMVELPAVNTPQFSWCRSKLDREVRPPDPVFSPDAIARGLYEAAQTAPRELYIGLSTLQLITGQAVAPKLMDYAASTAWDAQLDGPATADERPDNLFEPVPGPWGAEGAFGDRQQDSAAVVDPATIRTGLALAVGGAALGAAFLATRRSRDRDS